MSKDRKIPLPRVSPPSAEDIRAAREISGLNQAAAAELVHSRRRAWEGWEGGVSSMHPAIFELFIIKAGIVDLSDYRWSGEGQRETLFHIEREPFLCFYKNEKESVGAQGCDIRITISSFEYGPLSDSEAAFIRDIEAIGYGKAAEAVLTYEFGILDMARELANPGVWERDIKEAFVCDLEAALSLLKSDEVG